MASLDSLQTRQILAKGVVIDNVADAPVALRLRYIGTGTVTSVTTVTATNVVLITSDGLTDTYAFSAYITMGALADAINAAGIFECKVLDVLRSAASDNNLLASALTATNSVDDLGNAVYDIHTDTSAFFQLGVCLTPTRRSFGAPTGHRVHLQEIKYYATLGNAAADDVQIWKRNGTVETQIFGELSVSATATTINFASGEGKLTGNPDEELVVILKDSVSLSDTAATLRVTGIVE
jgi:hypothetical protein